MLLICGKGNGTPLRKWMIVSRMKQTMAPFSAPKHAPKNRLGLLMMVCDTAECKKCPMSCAIVNGTTKPMMRQMGFTAMDDTSKFSMTKSERNRCEKYAPTIPTSHAITRKTLLRNPRYRPTSANERMMTKLAMSIQFI